MAVVPSLLKDFGQIVCVKKVTKYVKIRNQSEEPQVITVVPVKDERILYGRFSVNPKKSVAPPGKTNRFGVTYLSFLENVQDLVFYDIFRDGKLTARLRAHAKSFGPNISTKVFNLKFFCFREVNQTMRIVTLENLTKCEAKFAFDMDEDYKHIRFSQTHGLIAPGATLHLNVFVNPTVPEIYFKTIYCLIQYHPPLIFNVMSIYQPKINLDPKNIAIKYPKEAHPDCNYAAYMEKLKLDHVPEAERASLSQKGAPEKDCLHTIGLEEEICWSSEDSYPVKKPKNVKDSIDVFVSTQFVDIKNQLETSKAIALVNFSRHNTYYYEWDRDPKEVFHLNPAKGEIEPDSKQFFTIYFSPGEADVMYHVELDLRVYFSEKNTTVNATDPIKLPLTRYLRIIGNSFTDASCAWLTHCYVIPKSLQLRSCVPEESVYGTFIIHRQGHLPISYSVVNTKETNYTIQPPLGYLSRGYQLFVVKFNGKSKEGVYVEDLAIMLNNKEINNEILKVATSVEIPNLIFDKDNTINFVPTLPGAQNSEVVLTKNPTNLHLSYEFKIPEDITWCEIVNPKGEVAPKHSIKIIFIFTPKIFCEYEGYIQCNISSIYKPDYVKTVNIHLKGSGQQGYLIATPSTHDYGECVYLEKKVFDIHLFNFSPVRINYRLTAAHRAFPVGNVENDVEITPNRGAISGTTSLKVQVAVTPHGTDVFQYAILCQNLKNDLDDTPACEAPKIIFSFRFEGVLPSIQVLDVQVTKGGYLYNPQWLWKMMNVNKINEALNSLQSEILLTVKFPETPETTLGVLIEANKYGPFKCDIRRKIMCPCFEASEEIITQSCLHTRHRGNTTCLKLLPKQRLILQFDSLFGNFSKCFAQWVLTLPYKRKIVINAKIVDIHKERIPTVSTYLHPVIKLQPIFIGDVSPPLQLHWLYNIYEKPASYELTQISSGDDTVKIGQVLRCINPKGVIPPCSSLPLAFLFTPNEIRLYSVQAFLEMGGTKFETLLIQGEGVMNIQRYKELSFEKNISRKPYLYRSQIDLYCSMKLVDINFSRTFSKIKRIFYLRNKSTTLTWSFRWHSFKVDNLIFAYIKPKEGRVEPGQKVLLTLNLQSFAYPTSVSFSISCDAINYTALWAYEEAIRRQAALIEKTKDYFTITEKKTTYESPVVQIPPKPETKHIYIGVNANIISSPNIQKKLRPHEQLRLQAEEEMEENVQVNSNLKIPSLQPVLEVFEKILWEIMNNEKFWEKIECRKNLHEINYLQLLPETRSKRKRVFNTSSLHRKDIQCYMQNEFKKILSKSLICKNEEPKTVRYEETEFNITRKYFKEK